MTVKSEPIAIRISKALAERIVSGQIEPGTRLRQDHIAAEFQTSHVPVREAFRRLEAQGLARSEPRRGVRVASFGLSDVKEVAEMRAVLEVLALRHAAPHLSSATLDRAEAVSRAGDKSVDVRAWEDANRTFHRMILEPCGMPRLLAAIDDLHAASARFLFTAWHSGWEARTDHEHLAILAALRKGEVDAACAMLERHVRRIAPQPGPATSDRTRKAFAITG